MKDYYLVLNSKTGVVLYKGNDKGKAKSCIPDRDDPKTAEIIFDLQLLRYETSEDGIMRYNTTFHAGRTQHTFYQKITPPELEAMVKISRNHNKK